MSRFSKPAALYHSLKVLLLLAMGMTVWDASAQEKWPMAKPMTLVVGWPPGSSFDIVARIIAKGIHEKYSNTVVVENRSGASGNIAQSHVARSKPDGYTFVVTTPGPAANNKLTFKSLPYDPLSDFTFVSVTNKDPSALVVRASLPVKNFKDFIEYAKANPGKVQMGSPGTGSYSHMTQLALQDLAKVSFNIVPYRGPPQVLQDLLGERLDAGMGLIGNYMPQIKAGKLKVLVIFSENRDQKLPDIPTAIEEGYPFSSQPWTGIEGPKAIPENIVAEMNRTVREILSDQAVIEKLAALGMTAAPSTPEEFETLVKAEMEKWRPIVNKYKISAQ